MSNLCEIEEAIGELDLKQQVQLLRDLAVQLSSQMEDLGWLQASESSFAFWDNEEDAVYDEL
jgi:hypothetical protein